MEGGGDRGRGGTAGVMYPRNQAAAGLEEMGAKLGVLGHWLSLLQQVGRWPLSLSSWVSNRTATPHLVCFSHSDGLLLGWREQIFGRRELRTSDKTISSLEKFCLHVCST